MSYTEIKPGLWRGPRPTAADLAKFSPPLETIIDLEPTKENAAPNEIYIPMSSVTKPKLADVRLAASLMDDQARRPLLVHCRQGVDRTGVVCAFWRVRYCYWTPQMAYQEMLSMGFHWLRYFFWHADIHKILEQGTIP